MNFKRNRTIWTGDFSHTCKVARVESTNFPFRIMYQRPATRMKKSVECHWSLIQISSSIFEPPMLFPHWFLSVCLELFFVERPLTGVDSLALRPYTKCKWSKCCRQVVNIGSFRIVRVFQQISCRRPLSCFGDNSFDNSLKTLSFVCLRLPVWVCKAYHHPL